MMVERDEGLENGGNAAQWTAEAQTMHLHASVGQLERARWQILGASTSCIRWSARCRDTWRGGRRVYVGAEERSHAWESMEVRFSLSVSQPMTGQGMGSRAEWRWGMGV